MALPSEAPLWGLIVGLYVIEGLLLLQALAIKRWAYRFGSEWRTPEGRESLFKEIAHGVMRAASERSGSLRGAASKQAEAAMGTDISGLAISGLASFLPNKYRAFAPLIAPYIQQFLEKQSGAIVGSNPNQGRNGGLP